MLGSVGSVWGRAILAVALAAGFSTLGQIDETLSQMHLPGATSASVADVAAPGTALDPLTARKGLEGWEAWDDARKERAEDGAKVVGFGTRQMRWLYSAVDSLFVTIPLALVVLVVAQRLRTRIAILIEQGEQERRRRRDRVVKIQAEAATGTDEALAEAYDAQGRATLTIGRLEGQPALLNAVKAFGLAYLGFDLLENLLIACSHPGLQLGALKVLGVVTSLKLLALAAATMLLLLVASTARRTRLRLPDSLTTPRSWHEVVALRVQVSVVAVLVLLVVLLPGDLGRQIDDAVLALAGRWEAIYVLGAVALLSTILWATGRRAIVTYCQQPRHLPGFEGQYVAGSLDAPPNAGRGRLGGWRTLAIGTLLALMVAVPGWLWWREVPGLVALVVPATVVAVVALLSIVLRHGPMRELPRFVDRQVPLWWLAAAPLLLVGVLGVRNGTLLGVSGASVADWLSVGAGGVMLLVVGALVLRRSTLEPIPVVSPWGDRLGAAAVVVGLGVATAGAIEPVRVGQHVTALTIVLVFLAMIATAVAPLAWVAHRYFAPGPLAAIGFRRLPVIALIGVCVVATSIIHSTWRYHDVEVIPSPHAGATPSFADALEQWHGRVIGPGDGDPDGEDDPTNDDDRDEPRTDRKQPMVFVATAGGGIRAAYWTSAVMSCLLEGTTTARYEDDGDPTCGTATQPAIPADQREAIFLASGISGGSLGLAVTRALGQAPDTYDEALSTDFLGPVVAGLAFRDAPNSVLRLDSWADRAAVLERAWGRSVEGGGLNCGFLVAAHSREPTCAEGSVPEYGEELAFPLLFLNGVATDDGCRLTVSALDLTPPTMDVGTPDPDVAVEVPVAVAPQDQGTDCYASHVEWSGEGPPSTGPSPPPKLVGPVPTLPGTRDVHDHLCMTVAGMRDVSLATAAHISARFPYVSPTGALTACGPDGEAAVPERRTFDVDGGLVGDTSGAGPIVELWPTIARQVAAWNEDASSTGICVTPRLIIVDNGYADGRAETGGTPSSRPLESIAPLEAYFSGSSRGTEVARQAAAIAFEQTAASSTCDDTASGRRVAHFYPLAHPGPQAPLGWALSWSARRDLHEQLFDKHRAAHNHTQVEIVRGWFGE